MQARNTGASGRLYIVSAPSGAGKTSLVKALVATHPGIALSVSHTTRPMRAGEREGSEYHFVDLPAFEAMVENAAFLEHARVFDHRYGTSKEWVAAHLAQGMDVILEIDWQGARQVRAARSNCIGIFILPPSCEVLEERLRGRGGDREEVIRRRMRDAVAEISHYAEYDYLIVNDEFDRALADLEAILRADRLTLGRQRLALARLLQGLMR
ncbi:MAG: guanylate kinase [Gammaproteobacteria bacterium]